MKNLIIALALFSFAIPALAQRDDSDSAKSKKTHVKKGKKIKGITETKDEKESRRHSEKIEKSRKTNKSALSKDTLFCSGKPVAICQEITRNLLGNATSYSIKSLNAAAEDIHLSLESVSSGSNTVYYWVWVREDIRFETEQSENPLDLICYYSVFHDSTFSAKNFNTLKQSKSKTISGYNGKPAPKPGSVEDGNRNRNDKVTFTGRDIRQSSVLIGHIESATSTSGGSIVTTYTIYNAEGNLVATAANHGVTDHEWDIVTANDNRQHHVTSSILHDQEDVVSYLVKLLYL